MRKKIYDIIEVAEENKTLSHIYDVFMIITIIISLIPLGFKEPPAFFALTEKLTTAIFIVDYLLRLMTADIKLKKGAVSFLIYPFTSMAIIDILSILPTIILSWNALRVLRAIRFVRALRVLKIFKAVRKQSR